MPIKKGKNRKTVRHNIDEIVQDWERDGTIGTSKPKTKKKARKQGRAVALKKARKSKSSKPLRKSRTARIRKSRSK